ncbi:MAG TPA: DNA topoisomerase, partial [Limnochordales bacterium]
MKLVIVESPAKARTLGKILGRGYQVRACMGHVRDLPVSDFGVDVERGFQPRYVIVRGKARTVRELQQGAARAQQVLVATDPDREGEAIGWHLAQLLRIPEHEPCRIEFHEVTQRAVTQAVKHPRPIDRRLVEAQQARRILDRIVGYRLSPLLWRKVRRGLSAGRVQSVALRLICEREEEIEAFTPREYWTLDAWFAVDGEGGAGEGFWARLVSVDGQEPEIPDSATAAALERELREATFHIQAVSSQRRQRHPPPPFTTSTLQQEAARRLGFTAKRTM